MSKEFALVPAGTKELALVIDDSRLRFEFNCPSKVGVFKIYSIDGGALVSTSKFKLVIAKSPSGQLGYAMIATPEGIESVDRQIRVLKTLGLIANDLDNEAGKSGDAMPYYGSFFPKILDTFGVDGRPACFLGFNEVVKTYQDLIPICLATEKVRVDLQTTIWIVGKMMKLLDYVNSMGFSIGLVDETNVLINPEYHGVFVLDWTNVCEENPSELAIGEEIAAVAKIAWFAAGGDNHENPPYDEAIMSKEHYNSYLAFLKKLMKGNCNAIDAYNEIYSISDLIWPKEPKTDGVINIMKRPFHEYCTYPKETVGGGRL